VNEKLEGIGKKRKHDKVTGGYSSGPRDKKKEMSVL
jgi:hypothetical protein